MALKPERTSRPRRNRAHPLLIVSLLFALATGVGAQPAFAASDADLLRELERAKQLEAEMQRREAEAAAAREAELGRKRREVSERNSALEREREARLKQAIAQELEMQDVMLERRERNETAKSRDLLGAHHVDESATGRTEPRAAPPEPETRDLPRAIFDEKSVSIAAGTPGFTNERKRKAVRLSLDADRDGRPEVVRFVDRKSGAWLRQEEDRNYDGRMDTFLVYEGGKLVAREIDTNHDDEPDVFEAYAGGRQTRRSLDRDHDDVVDAFYEYEGRFLARERHDADNNGSIDLEIEYEKGLRKQAWEDSDRDGRPDMWTRYQVVDGRETVTQIEVDKTGRGFADTFETFEPLDGKAVIARREEDMDGDGEVDLVSIYRKGKLVRREILKPEVVPL